MTLETDESKIVLTFCSFRSSSTIPLSFLTVNLSILLGVLVGTFCYFVIEVLQLPSRKNKSVWQKSHVLFLYDNLFILSIKWFSRFAFLKDFLYEDSFLFIRGFFEDFIFVYHSYILPFVYTLSFTCGEDI